MQGDGLLKQIGFSNNDFSKALNVCNDCHTKLIAITVVTPKFGWSAAILLQKASVEIADIIKTT